MILTIQKEFNDEEGCITLELHFDPDEAIDRKAHVTAFRVAAIAMAQFVKDLLDMAEVADSG